MQVHLARPDITQAEIDAVNEVIQSPILALGPWAMRFEKAIADYAGAKHAIAVNSGTSGLHLLVRSFDERTAFLARSMCNQGRGEAGVWLSHERLGYNYRMDELSAALGAVQMSRIDEIIAKRQRVADMYRERLSDIPGVKLPQVDPDVTRMSWFVYVIRVGVDEHSHDRQSAVRDHVMRRFQEANIGCRPYFTPIHLQPFYRDTFGFKEGDFPVTELAGRTSIAIPFHNHITSEEVDYVAEALERALDETQSSKFFSERGI